MRANINKPCATFAGLLKCNDRWWWGTDRCGIVNRKRKKERKGKLINIVTREVNWSGSNMYDGLSTQVV